MIESKGSQITDPLLTDKAKGPDRLNDLQINYARELIDNIHKLKSTPIEKTLPYLKYCCCCCFRKRKPRFDFALKRAIRRKLDIKVPKSDQLIEEDPFLLLGYGINSYFAVMKQLMIMVGLISLVTVPLMHIFSGQQALIKYPDYNYNQYTLGNIGGSGVSCVQATFESEKTALKLDCPWGTNINL